MNNVESHQPADDKWALRQAVAALDISDLRRFFAGVGELRSSIIEALSRSSAAEADSDLLPSIHELNLQLDSLVEERVRAEIERLNDEARRDPLTGLGHRRAFNQRLELEIERGRRYARHFALIIFDLDRFKAVNDREGHPTGDRLLKDLASILRSSLRQSDEAFRLGGDEFAAILPETRLETGELIARRIESRLLNSVWAGRCGVSWGVANWPEDLPSPDLSGDSLIALADQRLYQHKSLKQDQRRPGGDAGSADSTFGIKLD